MNKSKLKVFMLLCLFAYAHSNGQERIEGQIIKDFGKVFKIENTDYHVDTSQKFYAVFDVAKSPKEHNVVNKWLETGARYLNMHAANGVPVESMKVALVIHGAAYKDIISDEGYEKRFGVKNPNGELIKALIKANVQVILCGQSAAYRKVDKNEFIPGVQLSLSAMTALVQLQNQNFRLINF